MRFSVILPLTILFFASAANRFGFGMPGRKPPPRIRTQRPQSKANAADERSAGLNKQKVAPPNKESTSLPEHEPLVELLAAAAPDANARKTEMKEPEPPAVIIKDLRTFYEVISNLNRLAMFIQTQIEIKENKTADSVQNVDRDVLDKHMIEAIGDEVIEIALQSFDKLSQEKKTVGEDKEKNEEGDGEDNGEKDEEKDEQVDGKDNGEKYEEKDEQVDGEHNGEKDEEKDEQVDGEDNGQKDKEKDEQVDVEDNGEKDEEKDEVDGEENGEEEEEGEDEEEEQQSGKGKTKIKEAIVGEVIEIALQSFEKRSEEKKTGGEDGEDKGEEDDEKDEEVEEEEERKEGKDKNKEKELEQQSGKGKTGNKKRDQASKKGNKTVQVGKSKGKSKGRGRRRQRDIDEELEFKPFHNITI